VPRIYLNLIKFNQMNEKFKYQLGRNSPQKQTIG